MGIVNKELLKTHEEILLKEGWIKVHPSFNIDHFFTLDPFIVATNLGIYFSAITDSINGNPLGFLSQKVNYAKEEFWSSICPFEKTLGIGNNCPTLQASFPVFKTEYENQEAAFEELTYIVIKRIVDYLGKPKKIRQVLGTEGSEYGITFKHDVDTFDIYKVSILSHLYLLWDDVLLKVEYGDCWHNNGSFNKLSWHLKTNNIKSLASQVYGGIGIELNSNTYQIGELAPSFKLNSFPDYIQDYTKELIDNLYNDEFTRFNILAKGEPGTYKTSWAQSFASEVLGNQGYLVLSIDYNSLQNLVIPDYIDKVCIIINDVDMLALDREYSLKGETEQVMGWLDGTRTSFIKPFNMDKSSKVITLMTANSIERWDKAALRKGRIHKFLEFKSI